MQTKTEHQGTCLCGAITITASVKSNNVGVCHCDMCRRWGGGPLFAVECADDVVIDGSDHLAVYSSSDWAERGFCQTCGTHLFYRLKQENFYAIPVGIFDKSAGWKVTEQIFIDHKPSFYSLEQRTRNLTGEEVFAQYSAQ